MSAAIRVRVREAQCFGRPVVLRLPFRFGVITLTRTTQANLRLRVEDESGRSAWGIAAESLAAKWFDKDPSKSDAQNVADLARALELALELYRARGLATPFGLFADTYAAHRDAAAAEGIVKLAAGFGPALVDRAVADAVGRLEGAGFAALVRANRLGITASLTPDLAGFGLDPFLAGLVPRSEVAVRHTVGLLDPIAAEDVPPGGRVADGLPQTLDEVVAATGTRWFKLKIGGDPDADLARLEAIAAVLDRAAGDYRVTLDGNEQFEDASGFAALWRAMGRRDGLARLIGRVLFVEQPIARAHALAGAPAAIGRPVIVDESDDGLDVLPRALAAGYGGISSKNCKGFYKSLLNAARIARIAAGGTAPPLLSGEDLTTLAGISVQQDLALVGLLGLAHVERNGHHFIDGMSFAPQAEQDAFLAAHPDLYRRERRPDGTPVVRLAIRDGKLALGSLACPGFAVAAVPDWRNLAPFASPATGSPGT